MCVNPISYVGAANDVEILDKDGWKHLTMLPDAATDPVGFSKIPGVSCLHHKQEMTKLISNQE